MGMVLTAAGGAAAVAALYALARRLLGLGPPLAAAGAVALALAGYAALVLGGAAPAPGLDVAALHVAAYGLAGYAAALLGRARAARSAGARLPLAPRLIVAFLALVVVGNVAFVLVAQRGLPGWLAARLLPAPEGGGRVAATGFPGVVAAGSARKPLQHRARLEALARQRALGWQVAAGWLAAPRVGETAVFAVEARDRAGRPLSGATVEARFVRPGTADLDRAMALAATGAGVYHGRVRLDAPGRWEVTVTLRRGADRLELRGETWVQGER